MIDYFADTLRSYPVIALFLTVGLGFLIGRLHYKSFSLGSVTAGLIVGLVLGQLFDIQLSEQIKNVFFMLFLFSIGYSVGPGFFRSLKGQGLKQAAFAVCMSFCCFLVTLGLSHLMGYTSGETVGLFSGSQTCSSLLGVGGEAIENGTADAVSKTEQLNLIPICYAVTYVFGTLGTVVILSMLGPKLLGGLDKVKKQTAELQAEYSHNPWLDDPAYISAMHEVAFRTYRIENPEFTEGVSVRQAEALLKRGGASVFIDRIHRAADDTVVLATSEQNVITGDTIVLSGRTTSIVKAAEIIGTETADSRLLDFPVKQAPVLLRNRQIAGHTLRRLVERKFMHGVVVKQVDRGGKPLDIGLDDRLEKGDLITLVGPRKSLNRAAANIGHMDRPTTHTDIMFLCLALFIGGVIGTVTVMFDRVPLSFGTSGGSLIAGLVFGWLRSRRPTYGKIPRSVVWFLNQLGLNMFIAVVGINAGPQFISGIKTVGWFLPIVGAVATSVPLFIGLWLGQKVFKFPAAFTLGCCAGTRTCTAALGAVQDVIGSTLPTVGYTVTYAVSNILLIVWGLLAVFLSA